MSNIKNTSTFKTLTPCPYDSDVFCEDPSYCEYGDCEVLLEVLDEEFEKFERELLLYYLRKFARL